MFKNYLKVALRNIARHKGHSLINIVGLAIGIATCLLLFMWVLDELSYDRYHENADRIYRVIGQNVNENGNFLLASTPAPLGPALVREFSWIQRAVRLARAVDIMVEYNEKHFHEEIFFVDPEIFDIFTVPLVSGDPQTILKDPNTILISEEMKEKYFGPEDPIMKTITLNDRLEFKITGVFKTMPRNSHFRFHFLCHISRYRKSYLTNWNVSNYYTYILTVKDPPLGTFKEKMPDFVEKYHGKKAVNDNISYFLQPLTRIHLHSHVRNEINPNQHIETVYIFSAIALFILFIACLNYINLATARFSGRAKEVSLRKVLGATSPQLLKQFLGESLLFAVIALPLALLLAKILLPIFNDLSGKALTFHYFDNIYLAAGLVGIILAVGFIAGLVPALFITAFHPTAVIKGNLKTSPMIPALRRYLVVFQFAFSILFTICTLLISQQLNYMRTTKLGLDKDNVLIVHLQNSKEALLKCEILRYEFAQYPNVLSASAADFAPGKTFWNNNYRYEGVKPEQYLLIGCFPVDYDFLETLRINILEGRGFSRNFPSDEKNAFIINEAAAKKIGWEPAEAIGKAFDISNGWKKGTIIGIVQNFHYNSLHNEVDPVVLYIDPEAFRYILIRINPGHIPGTLKFLEKKWQEIVPDQPFVYSFLGEDFDRLYKSEFKLQKIFMIVTLLALLIACLGLFGLTSFSVEQRTREIGIRKIMGAPVSRITLMLSKEFTLGVLAANILAWPIAWYTMHKWLQNFANRVTILPWPFLLAGLAAFAIALVTISYKAFRAASANPIETLRYE